MPYQLMRLSTSVYQPDGAVGHTISEEPLVLVKGESSDMARYRDFERLEFIKVAIYVPITSIIKQDRLVIILAGTDDVKVKLTRTNHFVSGNVQQGIVFLTYNQQLAAIVQMLQSEWLSHVINRDDLCSPMTYHHQMTSVADGVALACS